MTPLSMNSQESFHARPRATVFSPIWFLHPPTHTHTAIQTRASPHETRTEKRNKRKKKRTVTRSQCSNPGLTERTEVVVLVLSLIPVHHPGLRNHYGETAASREPHVTAGGLGERRGVQYAPARAGHLGFGLGLVLFGGNAATLRFTRLPAQIFNPARVWIRLAGSLEMPRVV